MAREKLTSVQVERAYRADPPPTKLTDGGLYLYRGRSWRWDYTFQGKRNTLVLGTFPEVSLAKARTLFGDARRERAAGDDPNYRKKVRQYADPDARTFGEIAEEFVKLKRAGWSETHLRTVRLRLDKHLLPVIGARPVAAIDVPELLALLRRIEARGTIETAHRVRTVAGQVFRFAVQTGRAERDITRDLHGALETPERRSYAALTDPAAIGGLLRAIDGYEHSVVVRHALQLAPHVALRPTELREAAWSEIDLDATLWTIPAARMKGRRRAKADTTSRHLVPLTPQTIEILRSLEHYTGGGRLLFPGARTDERAISDNTLNAALRVLGFGPDVQVMHGFRAMFSSRLNDEGDFDPELIEAQLAHLPADKVRAAYNRASYVKRRRAMMVWWSDALDRYRGLGVAS